MLWTNEVDLTAADENDLRRLLGEVASFSAVRPSAEVEAAHLRAMTSLAREVANSPAQPVIMARDAAATHPSYRRLAGGLVGSALATPLCVVALAAAGMNLPHSLRAPFDAAGIELPNEAPSHEVRTVVERAPIRAGVLSRGWGIKDTIAPDQRNRHLAHSKAEGGSESGHDGRGGLPGDSSTFVSESSGTSPAAQPPAAPSGTPGVAAPPSSGGTDVGNLNLSGAGEPGAGEPSGPPKPTAPAGPAKDLPGVPELATRPGKGCGDENHLHLRADEC